MLKALSKSNSFYVCMHVCWYLCICTMLYPFIVNLIFYQQMLKWLFGQYKILVTYFVKVYYNTNKNKNKNNRIV